MTNKTEFSPTEDSEGNIHIGDNIAPPREHTLQAAMVWTTEDFLSAKPYPIPNVTEKMVSEFIEKRCRPRRKGEAA